MTVLFISFAVIVLAVVAMSIGVLAGRSPIRGSCGGVGGCCGACSRHDRRGHTPARPDNTEPS